MKCELPEIKDEWMVSEVTPEEKIQFDFTVPTEGEDTTLSL